MAVVLQSVRVRRRWPWLAAAGVGAPWVAELVNKRGGEPFDSRDEQRVSTLATSLAILHRLGSVCECGPVLGQPRTLPPTVAADLLTRSEYLGQGGDRIY